MNYLRYLLAVILWRWQCAGWLRRFLPYSGGRWVDWMPVRCEGCGWMGPLRWCFHTYKASGFRDDVQASDECPHCGSDDLELER